MLLHLFFFYLHYFSSRDDWRLLLGMLVSTPFLVPPFNAAKHLLCVPSWLTFSFVFSFSGVPIPNEKHAIIMVRFAHDILTRMNILIQAQLIEALGEDTANLQLRAGLHSGTVTVSDQRCESVGVWSLALSFLTLQLLSNYSSGRRVARGEGAIPALWGHW